MTKDIEENAGFCFIESEECQTALIYGDVHCQSKSSKEKEKLYFGKYSHQDRNKLFQFTNIFKDLQSKLNLKSSKNVIDPTRLRPVLQRSNTISDKKLNYQIQINSNNDNEDDSYLSKSISDKFSLKRHKSYKKNKDFPISAEELEKINRRRGQGRSVSAQVVPMPKSAHQVRLRTKSLSSDDNQPFKDLLEQRLKSSRETELCSTDL